MTLAEAKILTKAVTRKYVRHLRRDLWFRAATLAHCAAMGVVVTSALMLSYWLRCCSPEIFWWVFAAVICYFGGLMAYHRRYLHGVALVNRSDAPAGTRHVIDAHGYSVERNGQHTFIPWHRIAEMDRQSGLLLISTSAFHFWPIVPATFADRDVEDFCRELEQRWNAMRGRRA